MAAIAPPKPSMNEAHEQDPYNNSCYGSLVDSPYKMISLPVLDVILRREQLFQEGMQQFAHVIGDYELAPGRRLIDTTPEERLMMAATWSMELQDSRLAAMGLG